MIRQLLCGSHGMPPCGASANEQRGRSEGSEPSRGDGSINNTIQVQRECCCWGSSFTCAGKLGMDSASPLFWLSAQELNKTLLLYVLSTFARTWCPSQEGYHVAS